MVTTTNCPLATARGVTPLDCATWTGTCSLTGTGFTPGGKSPGSGITIWVSMMKLVTDKTVSAPPEVSEEMLAVTLADAERVPHWVVAVVVPPGGVTAQLIGLLKLTFIVSPAW
jgi:hypothetical protein